MPVGDQVAVEQQKAPPAGQQADMPNAAREAEVAQRGQHVMPFSLEQTLHVFTKTAKGGVQKVVARNADDIAQTRLIREHVKSIRTQFLKGDFSGPSHIHGDDMPGLAALKAARPGAITIVNREVQGGATLTYTTRDPALIGAIHQWFDAQVSDHGKHADPLHHH